jgi:hypothetical protein
VEQQRLKDFPDFNMHFKPSEKPTSTIFALCDGTQLQFFVGSEKRQVKANMNAGDIVSQPIACADSTFWRAWSCNFNQPLFLFFIPLFPNYVSRDWIMYLIAFMMGPEFYGHPVGRRSTGAQEWIVTYKGKKGWPVYNLPPPAGVPPGFT